MTDFVALARDLAHRARGQVDKRCSGCKETFPAGGFNRCASGRYGLHNHCRKCQKASKRRYYLANREKEIAAGAAYAMRPEVRQARVDRYASDHAFRAEQLAKNRVRRRTPEARQKANLARAALIERSPTTKAAIYTRARIRKALLGINKSASTLRLVGCSYDQLVTHLEYLFKPGMSWANYAYRGWHIDHRRPCASFDLTDPVQQAACFHYTNLRPEWRYENQSKGSKLLDETSQALGAKG